MEYGYNLNSFRRNVREDGLASALIEDGKQTLYDLKEISLYPFREIGDFSLKSLVLSVALPIGLYQLHKERVFPWQRERNQNQF
ncbi:MAG: hypothetical protein AABW91_00605 [Nanoarchaeota archaeon]